MTSHFSDKRGPDPLPQSNSDTPLSGVSSTSREVESTYLSLRYNLRSIDSREILHQLLVVAKNPKLPGHERIFDLSHHLAAASDVMPEKIQRFATPDVPMQEQLSIIRAMCLRLQPDNVSLPVAENSPTFSQNMETVDELEPTLAFQPSLFTSLDESLSGVSVRGVTVLFNKEPFLQFRVTEDDTGCLTAHVVVVPFGVEVPLLDRSGQLVEGNKGDEVLHDFTYLLYQNRNASQSRLLSIVSTALLHRERIPGSDLHQRVGAQLAMPLLVLNRHLNPDCENRSIFEVAPALAPNDGWYLHRQLPDGGVVWMAHDESNPYYNEVRLVGDSCVSARYNVKLQFSPSRFSKVRLAYHKLLRDQESWPSFEKLADILSADPFGRISIKYSEEAQDYPVRTNELADSLLLNPAISITRGKVPPDVLCQTTQLPQFIDQVVRGRVPLFIRIEGDSPATSWSITGFFDETLRGLIFLRNDFGGTITLNTDPFVLDDQLRRNEIHRVLQRIALEGGALFSTESLSPIFTETRGNLPSASPKDLSAYANVEASAQVITKALGGVGFSTQVAKLSWTAQRSKEGEWNLTLPAIFSERSVLPYLINMRIGPQGVWELAYSRGLRGPLGGLFGRRLLPGYSPGYLSLQECEQIVTTICKPSSFESPMQEYLDLRKIHADLTLIALAPMRELDPEGPKKDLLLRLWSGLKRIYRDIA